MCDLVPACWPGQEVQRCNQLLREVRMGSHMHRRLAFISPKLECKGAMGVRTHVVFG